MPKEPKAPNLLVRHQGMGWPVGAVVPPAAFPHGYADHIVLGAVAEVDQPVTHGATLAADLAAPRPASEREALDENARLRTRLAEAEARAAGLAVERDAARTEAAALRTEVASLTALLDQATASARLAAGDALQARLDAGPGPGG